MRKLFLSFCLSISLSFCFGQKQSVQSLTDSLQYLKTDTLDCNAAIYWRIISYGEKAIPYLIEKLSDTTITGVRHPCKATKLNVGELSYFALREIAFFPLFDITHIQFDFSDQNGCWSFYDYLFSNANKKKFQQMLRKWYAGNKRGFKGRAIPVKERGECQIRFGITKYLEWKDKG